MSKEALDAAAAITRLVEQGFEPSLLAVRQALPRGRYNPVSRRWDTLPRSTRTALDGLRAHRGLSPSDPSDGDLAETVRALDLTNDVLDLLRGLNPGFRLLVDVLTCAGSATYAREPGGPGFAVTEPDNTRWSAPRVLDDVVKGVMRDRYPTVCGVVLHPDDILSASVMAPAVLLAAATVTGAGAMSCVLQADDAAALGYRVTALGCDTGELSCSMSFVLSRMHDEDTLDHMAQAFQGWLDANGLDSVAARNLPSRLAVA